MKTKLFAKTLTFERDFVVNVLWVTKNHKPQIDTNIVFKTKFPPLTWFITKYKQNFLTCF